MNDTHLHLIPSLLDQNKRLGSQHPDINLFAAHAYSCLSNEFNANSFEVSLLLVLVRGILLFLPRIFHPDLAGLTTLSPYGTVFVGRMSCTDSSDRTHVSAGHV